MAISLQEYLANAQARDAEAKKEKDEALACTADAESSHDDAISALIDQHPIGRPMSKFGHTID